MVFHFFVGLVSFFVVNCCLLLGLGDFIGFYRICFVVYSFVVVFKRFRV